MFNFSFLLPHVRSAVVALLHFAHPTPASIQTKLPCLESYTSRSSQSDQQSEHYEATSSSRDLRAINEFVETCGALMANYYPYSHQLS